MVRGLDRLDSGLDSELDSGYILYLFAHTTNYKFGKIKITESWQTTKVLSALVWFFLPLHIFFISIICNDKEPVSCW